jgi:hypothetical protein
MDQQAIENLDRGVGHPCAFFSANGICSAAEDNTRFEMREAGGWRILSAHVNLSVRDTFCCRIKSMWRLPVRMEHVRESVLSIHIILSSALVDARTVTREQDAEHAVGREAIRISRETIASRWPTLGEVSHG